ncbi:DUF4118 domain-containing protein [Methylobacterium iners]|uniref:DUF4118 domain-containing protein n=1 Tax=Methylobacterium iners TaxID=418707 RepID=UPI00366FB3EF
MFFSHLFRGHPRSIAYPSTILLVAIAFAVERWAWSQLQIYPFFFFYLAIIISGALFIHGSGYLATALSAGLLTLFLPPIGSIEVTEPRDRFALAMFVAVGLGLSALLDQLRKPCGEPRRRWPVLRRRWPVLRRR